MEKKPYQAPQIFIVNLHSEGLIAASTFSIQDSHADEDFMELSQKSESIWD